MIRLLSKGKIAEKAVWRSVFFKKHGTVFWVPN